MKTDKFKSDLQKLSDIFQPNSPSFHSFTKTIRIKWGGGTGNDDPTVIFISFIRHLTKNNCEALNGIKCFALNESKLRLLPLFFSFLDDDERKANKSERYTLHATLTKDAPLDAILAQVFNLSPPRHFTHEQATDKKYERYYHSTTNVNPDIACEFKKTISEKWYCYKDGLLSLDGSIIVCPDEEMIELLDKIIGSEKSDGFEVHYAYLSPDNKLVYTCKSEASIIPKYTFELTFTDSPSSYNRALQEEKIMKDFLWSGNASYDAVIAEATNLLHNKYGIHLWKDFLRNGLITPLADFILSRLRTDSFMPAVKDHTTKLKSDIKRLFEDLSECLDEETIKEQLLNALKEYPKAAANTYAMSPPDENKLKSDIIEATPIFFDEHIGKYSFRTPEENALRGKITMATKKRVEDAVCRMEITSWLNKMQENLKNVSSGRLKPILDPTQFRNKSRILESSLNEILDDKALLKLVEPVNMHATLVNELELDIQLNDEEAILMDNILLRNDLKSAFTLHPEKILERYDFLSPLNDWRINASKFILDKIVSAYFIEKLIDNDKDVISKFFCDNQLKRDIEDTIRSVWNIDKKKEEDLTAVVMTLIHFLTKNSNRGLYSIRKAIAEKNAPYYQIPLLIYPSKPSKQWMEYKDDDRRLSEVIADNAISFLTQAKKHKEQRKRLKELLFDYTDTKREKYIWGNGSKFDHKLQEELNTVSNEGYKLPSYLDLNYFRQSLHDYLCNDTKAFISKYDFSDTLENWILHCANIFINAYPRVESVLDNDKNIKAFKEEYEKSTDIFDEKNKRGNKAKRTDNLRVEETGNGYIKFNKDKESTENSEDDDQNFWVALLKNDKRALVNYKYDCELPIYLTRVKNLNAKKLQRDEINKIKPKEPKIKDKKEQIKIDEKKRKQEALYLLEYLRIPGMQDCFMKKSKNYYMMLDIFEMVYDEEMEDDEIKRVLVKMHENTDVKKNIMNNYPKLKQRSVELIKEFQIIITNIMDERKKLADKEKEIYGKIKKYLIVRPKIMEYIENMENMDNSSLFELTEKEEEIYNIAIMINRKYFISITRRDILSKIRREI